MPFIVHTIPEGQREVERLEALVAQQQYEILTLSRKVDFDAEYFARERVVDKTKIQEQQEIISDFKKLITVLATRLNKEAAGYLRGKIEDIRKNHPTV